MLVKILPESNTEGGQSSKEWKIPQIKEVNGCANVLVGIRKLLNFVICEMEEVEVVAA